VASKDYATPHGPGQKIDVNVDRMVADSIRNHSVAALEVEHATGQRVILAVAAGDAAWMLNRLLAWMERESTRDPEKFYRMIDAWTDLN
jgi:hypothetical protein